MKSIIVASLSILALSLATATTVKAAPLKECSMKVVTNSLTTGTVITPFELVSRGYKGAYKAQGIPSFSLFISDTRRGTITAKNLVQAAIDAKELAPELINDRNYLNDVTIKLFIR